MGFTSGSGWLYWRDGKFTAGKFGVLRRREYLPRMRNCEMRNATMGCTMGSGDGMRNATQGRGASRDPLCARKHTGSRERSEPRGERSELR